VQGFFRNYLPYRKTVTEHSHVSATITGDRSWKRAIFVVFYSSNTNFSLSYVITSDVLLWSFLLCASVYDNIIYNYKYGINFVNVGIKLLNI